MGFGRRPRFGARFHHRMPVDREYLGAVRVQQVDLERLPAVILAIPFDDAGEYQVILACRKCGRVELIVDTAQVEFAAAIIVARSTARYFDANLTGSP